MPKLGESVMEATILTWEKQVGDTIEMDENVVVIATDKLPGGTSQAFDINTWTGIQQTIANANNLGIKYIVVGSGVDLSGTINGLQIYPWRALALQTSGGYNNLASAANINSLLVSTC